MTDRATFKKTFGDALRQHAFQRKGQSWYVYGSDCIVVLNLQKDDFSDMYYVNFGVWIKLLGEEQYPQENHCHVRARLERIFPAQRELIFDACTIGLEGAALPQLIALLHSDVAPLCQRCLTITGLKEEITSGRIPHYYVIRVARSLLGLPERK